MAQAEKTGAKTGTKGTDVPDVPSARFTAKFNVSLFGESNAPSATKTLVFQETRNQKPVVISFKKS